mmetsp:Transcript_16950/g.30668  ORF Transcript_16950/g.30668 Transcript_16950/m.30668 type:complete len:269 (+) Transcript_16950:216-1022(+)
MSSPLSATNKSTTSPPDNAVKKHNNVVDIESPEKEESIAAAGANGAATLKSVSLPAIKMWPSSCNITDSCHAFLSPDGDYIKCLRCCNKGRTKGVIRVRHPYTTSCGEDHVKMTGHINAVQNHLTIKANKKDIHHHKQGQSNMTSFFIKAEKNKPASASTANTAPKNNDNNADKGKGVINEDEEGGEKKSRYLTCAGMYNSFSGSKMKEVFYYAEYIIPSNKQRWSIGSYGDMSLIKSRECTSVGILKSKEPGLVCKSCKELCESRGN